MDKAEHRIRMDAARNRAVDPASVIEEADGRLKMKFVASFSVGDGCRSMISFWAYSQEDAKRRVALMRQSLEYEGLIAEFVPVEVEYGAVNEDGSVTVLDSWRCEDH